MKEKKTNIKIEKQLHTTTSRKKPVFRLFGKILKPFYRTRFESETRVLPDKAIIVSIHSAKAGPMAISLGYPKFHAIWGHHAMLGSYKERFRYLKDVLYIQKMHKSRLSATLKATYEAAFSKMIYKGMRIIGTYTDMRFLGCIRNSIEFLDSGASVVVFPEDSSEGYFDEVRSAFTGFVILADMYYRERGEDVPIIPMYVAPKKHRLILGSPRYAREMELAGASRQQIADSLAQDINELYRKYISTGSEVPTVTEDAPVRDKKYYGEAPASAEGENEDNIK